MLGALLVPAVVKDLGKLMGFQVCAIFLYGIQMIDPYKESPLATRKKKANKQSTSAGNKLGYMPLKVYID